VKLPSPTQSMALCIYEKGLINATGIMKNKGDNSILLSTLDLILYFVVGCSKTSKELTVNDLFSPRTKIDSFIILVEDCESRALDLKSIADTYINQINSEITLNLQLDFDLSELLVQPLNENSINSVQQVIQF
jgi:hypothetical protein